MTNSTSEKNQDLTEDFCQSEEIKDSLLYIENFDRFCFYQQNVGYYRLFPYKKMEEKVYFFLKKNARKNLTLGTCRDVVEQVKFECYKRTPTFESIYISFTDKLFNIRTQEFEDFDPQKFSFTSVPVSSEDFLISILSPEISMPMFQSFLDKVLVKKYTTTPDIEAQKLIQEMFGYCLYPGTEAESCFFLVGDGANGKSKLLDVLKAMVGLENCGSESIENLTHNNFATASLIGKRLNVCTEESSDFVKQDKFKALVSGEAVQVEKKFADSFSERLPVKFIFATNELPNFSGFNLGFRRRIQLIPFYNTFLGQGRDPLIAVKIIEAELPKIYLWALHGMVRLLKNSLQFSASASSIEKTDEFEMAISSAVMFIREQYEEIEGCYIPNVDLYYEYQTIWCKNAGKKPMGNGKFFREIGKTLKLETKFRRNIETGGIGRVRQLRKRLNEFGVPLEVIEAENNPQEIIF